MFGKLTFLGDRHCIPFSNDLGDDFRLSQTGKLVLVRIVLLATELSIYHARGFSGLF